MTTKWNRQTGCFRVRAWLLCLVLLAGMGGISHGDASAQPPDEYTGLDVLFLVDQSGSMGGRSFDGPDRVPTDPLDLRFEALQYAVELLGEYRLGINRALDVRIATIYFGDESLMILNWVPIADTTDRPTWDQQLAVLQTTLSADGFRELRGTDRANLGNTNFLEAIGAASETFALAPSAESQRLRVMILLTDGEPCVVDGPNRFDCQDGMAKQHHMDELQTLAQQALADVDLLYVMVLDSSGYLWNLYHEDWETIARSPEQVWPVDSSQQVGVAFRKLLIELIRRINPEQTWSDKEGLVPGANRRVIPPYQRSMLVSLFKSSVSQGMLTISLPDGSVLAPGDDRLAIANQDSPIETWTISTPPPGEWIFTLGSSQDQIDVFLDLIPIEVQTVEPPTSVHQFSSVPLRLTILDDRGNPLPSYPDPYLLHVEGQLELPDGTTETLSFAEHTPGVFEASLSPDMVGAHALRLNAGTQNADGTPYLVYQSPLAVRFEVIGAALRAEALPQGEYLAGEDLAVHVRLMYQDGVPVEDDEVVVSAQLTGDGFTDQFELGPTGEGHYRGVRRLERPGEYVVDIRATHRPSATTIDTLRTDPLKVVASQPIEMVIASPAEGETLFTSPLYPLLRTAIEFQVETRLQDSGERVNLAALADGGSLELTLELLDETGTPVATGIALAPGSEEGVYMTTVRELEPAAYRAQVQVAGEVRRPYLLNSAARVRSIRFEQAVNPRAYVIWGGVGVAAVVSAGTSLYSLRRRMVRRAHPARGKIILVESLDYGDTENRLHTINLDAYNSNTISLGRRQLPRDVMRRTGITRITIVCPDEQAAQARRVQVTVKCGSETVLENRSLSPGGSLTVSSKRGIKTLEEGTSLQLYKDIGDLDSMGSSGVEYFLA